MNIDSVLVIRNDYPVLEASGLDWSNNNTEPIFAKGGWQNDNQFVLMYGNSRSCTFEAHQVDISIRNASGGVYSFIGTTESREFQPPVN
jgi:hypothetical protein